MVMKKNAFYYIARFFVYFLLILVALACVLPFFLVISVSLSSEASIVEYGYQLIPKEFSTAAYQYLLKYPKQVLDAYKVTIIVSVVGTFISVLMMSGLAYPLSRQDFRWRGKLALFIYFTMLFNGGMVPTYIMISRYLHLKNTIFVLILPLLVNAWNVFLLRTFFQKMPVSLVESAKLDGANELYIFFKIALPLTKTGIATITIFMFLAYWNDWYLSMLYMSNDEIVSLQYMMYRILSNVEFLTKAGAVSGGMVDKSSIPDVNIRMAICVIAAGPMIFLFSFFQKYFTKGIVVGAVKE